MRFNEKSLLGDSVQCLQNVQMKGDEKKRLNNGESMSDDD